MKPTPRRQRSLSLIFHTFLVAMVGLASATDAGRGEILLHEESLDLFMAGTKVGTSVGRDYKGVRGYRVERDSLIQLTRGTLTLAIQSKITAHLNRDFSPRKFRYEKQDKSGKVIREGFRKGKFIYIETTQAGETVKSKVEMKKGMILSSGLSLALRQRLTKPGTFKIPVFLEEMGTAAEHEITVTLEGDEVHVKTLFEGIETLDVLDKAGKTIRSSTPSLGLEAVPSGSTAPKSSKPVDVMAMSTWPAPQLPRGPLSMVRYRISTDDAGTFEMPEDLRQKVIQRDEKSLEIEVRPGVASKKSLSAADRRRFLSETTYEPLGNQDLKDAVVGATADARSDEEKVQALVKFVYEHVEEKSLDRAYASAVATLKSGTGDCTEHSVLLSALLRIAGLPTRLVDGVVISGGRVGYHEWVEVYLEGRGFVPADPTFGVFPAGPDRLKFAEGASDPEGMLKLSVAAARLLKGMKVEVVEAKP
jgi:hypothetical protein